MNAARSINVAVGGLLNLLARMCHGMQVHSGMLHYSLDLQHAIALCLPSRALQ